jgi:hypothetical protein
MSQAQTPYSPPLAPVRDPAEPEVPKPAAIWWAAACLWTSAAIVVLTTSTGLAGGRVRAEMAQVVATALVSAGLLALVALLLNGRRSWARWLYLVIYALGIGSLALAIALAPRVFLSQLGIGQAILLVQAALQSAALILMFTPAAGRWLRSKR